MEHTDQRNEASCRHLTAWATNAVTLDGVSIDIQGEFSWQPTDGLIGRLSLDEQHKHVRHAAEMAVVQHLRWIHLSDLLLAIGQCRPEGEEPGDLDRSGPGHLRIQSVGIPPDRGSLEETRALFALNDALFRFRLRRRGTPCPSVQLVAERPVALDDIPHHAFAPRGPERHA